MTTKVIHLCSQELCMNVATRWFVWPGNERQRICEIHHTKAEHIAKALDFTLASGILKDETPMGYGTNGLTFKTLRAANIERLPLFKNGQGQPNHTKSDGSDWSPAQWLQAVIGELGEYANLRKKVERGDIHIEEAKPQLAAELADVIIYLDILAWQLNIDLGEAVMITWNRKSQKQNIPLYIDAEDWHRLEK